MDWIEMLKQIFEVCVIPLLGIVAGYIVKLVKMKSSELTEKISDKRAAKYIEMLSQTISDCVITTNQTYVDSLKADGKFDTQAQKEAFTRTYQAVLSILSNDAITYLISIYGDLEAVITSKIESMIYSKK